MIIQSLPRYCGLPQSRNGWGEPDGHGRKPSLGLRDYVVGALVATICLPLLLRLVVVLWTGQQYVHGMNSARDQQLEEEARRSLLKP
jgi:hypothetical protein